MKLLSKSLKSLFGALIVFAFIFCIGSINGCSNTTNNEKAESACQDTGGTARANCNGTCPSEASPNCYVRFRKAGSSDDWENSGQSSMDRTPGIEYACYCDS